MCDGSRSSASTSPSTNQTYGFSSSCHVTYSSPQFQIMSPIGVSTKACRPRTSFLVHSVFPDIVGPDTVQVNGCFRRPSIMLSGWLFLQTPIYILLNYLNHTRLNCTGFSHHRHAALNMEMIPWVSGRRRRRCGMVQSVSKRELCSRDAAKCACYY